MPRVIKGLPRPLVLGAAGVALAVLPAVGGCGNGRPGVHPQAGPSSAVTVSPSGFGPGSPAVTAPGLPGVTVTGAPGVSGAPGVGVTLPGPSVSMPAPVGWSLTDVPSFPPAPPPEPITLPAGNRAVALARVPVTQPVAFITIDDGYLKSPEALKLFAAARVPVTLFLTTDAIHDDPKFFDRLRPYGAVIEAHTISHPMLKGRGYDFQKRQICGSADRLGEWYGRRPVLFRPPFGAKDETTLRAAHDCGIKAVFLWKETVHKGKVRYQDGKGVKPGDIILMHFRPAFVQDFLAALRAIHKAGLTPALLEDYVPGAAPAR